MIATSFEYVRAASLDDAIAKLKEARGAGKLISGGHSLVPLMKLRLSEPGQLIDIARIPGLAGIRKAGESTPMIGNVMSGSPKPNVECRQDFEMHGE